MNTRILATASGLSATGMRYPRAASAQALALPIPIEIPLGRMALFAVLSLADLLLTWVLLRHSDGIVYESNPIANLFLNHYGWAGMVIFKFTDMLIVAWVAIVLCFFQPRVAQRVLSVACGIVGSVILYSSFLALEYG